MENNENSFWFGSRINNPNDIKSPISFNGKSTISPILNLNNQINSNQRFAITSTTENGKYVRGNLIYYKLNDVEIYAPLNFIIMVDTFNNTLFLKEAAKVSSGIAPSNPESKEYVILYTDINYEDSDIEYPYRWESIVGRSNVYEAIKSNAALINIDKSIVIVSSVSIQDALTVREFVKYLQNANLVDSSDDFNIDDYIGDQDII